MMEQNDKLNLSQSLEVNSAKIEETHKLIQQIETQLQKLTLLPSVALATPTEINYQNQNEQYQKDIFQNQFEQQYDKNIEANYTSNHQIWNQLDNQTKENAKQSMNYPYNKGEDIQNNQQSQQFDKRQNVQYKQLSTSNQLLKTNQNIQQREIGKIRSQVGHPQREERSIFGDTSDNKSLVKDLGLVNQSRDIKELQKEYFQEMRQLEQVHKKKLQQKEEEIEPQKSLNNKQVTNMQNIIQKIEQKENQIGYHKNRQLEQLQIGRVCPDQISFNEMMVITRKLEICEKEKYELQRENQELSCQYKLVVSQNQILQNKYNRILSLYNQLVESDKERFIQLQYADTVSQDHSIFTSPNKKVPLQSNDVNNSSNYININSPTQINLKDYSLKKQNDLDLFDEIYQQRNETALNQLIYKPFSINNSASQKNIYSQYTKNQTFLEEQMNTSNQNHHINIQNLKNNEQIIQNQYNDIRKQNEEIQSQINQHNIKQNLSNLSDDDENNHVLQPKDIGNYEFNNQQTTKQIQNHQKENNAINNIKSPSKSTKKMDLVKNLQNNVNDIKSTLDENLRINDNNSENQKSTNTLKVETMQNILDISGQVQSKKTINKKPTITSKSTISNKSSTLMGKNQTSSNKDIKLKPTKKQKK